MCWNKVRVTQAQANNWADFRLAESILPKNSSVPVWQAVDIIRERRKGLEYKEIIMITGYSENSVRNVCQWAGMGRGFKCITQ
jgi:hypothetical protein